VAGGLSLRVFCIHRGLLGQRMISRYKKKLPKGEFLRSMGGLEVVDRVFVGAGSAQQMPNKVLRSNAGNAAPGK
jgi:hypothetical protein